MQWYLDVLKKYAIFSGRARRKEYWFFALFNAIFSIVLSIIDGAIGSFSVEGGIGLLSGLYTLAILIPGLAVGFRRLHDTGRSAWWLLIVFVPLVGAIVLLVFTLQDSEAGENQYGPNPKALAA